jgi:hypothetical protein
LRFVEKHDAVRREEPPDLLGVGTGEHRPNRWIITVEEQILPIEEDPLDQGGFADLAGSRKDDCLAPMQLSETVASSVLLIMEH